MVSKMAVRNAMQINFGSRTKFRWRNKLTEGSIEYIDLCAEEFVYKKQNVAENKRVKFNDLVSIAEN